MSKLLAFVTRIERLQEEKRSIEEDIKSVYAEIASDGYDKKAVREVVKRRGKDQSQLSEFETIVQLYEDELANGMVSASQARDAREGQARPQIVKLEMKLDGGATTSPTAQGNGVAGSRPEQADDDGVMAFPARRSSNSTQSPEVATQHEGRANSESAVTAFPAANYTPTPVPAAAPIDLTIPEFLRRTPAQIGGAA